MLKRLFIVTILLICTSTVTASDDSPISILTDDALTEIIASTYADYDDPIEFTYVASVSKVWHAAIKSPLFMEKCKANGFVEPVIMFRYVPSRHLKILEHNLTCMTDSSLYFKYIDPREMRVDFPFIGFFYLHGFDYKNANSYLGIWTNPSKTIVFNQWLNFPNNEAQCAQSHMKLVHYIAQYEKKKKLKKETPDGHYLMQHPITAEPLFHRGTNKQPSDPDYIDCLKSYDVATTTFETSIPKQRFIKKIPSSFKFLVPLSILPTEVLTEIVAWAYADYDDPIEFTHLATVSKAWHAAIKSPLFMEKCKAKGFVKKWPPTFEFKKQE